MGIRGLTTYINNRSHLYLENYELHNTSLVIDGNGIASQLYKWHCKANDCFTGDYDKYAQVVQHFFTLLKGCNIVSYVIFDGGYEHKKLRTVVSRMKSKIQTADKLSAVTEGSESVFPLFLREVFLDVITQLGISCARCEYEGDTEIANLAKALNCPVLSFDSDFYIYGCLYIPFNTVELNIKKGKDKSTQPMTPYFYLPSKIYRIQKFLDSFGGLDQNNLPILAVLLGNDYVKRSTFAPFFRNLKIQKCHGIQSDQQKLIKSVIVWLQNETPESAIKTVLNRFKSEKRRVVMKKIRKAISGYFCINTELLEFLNIKVSQTEVNTVNLDDIEKNLDNVEQVSDKKNSVGEYFNNNEDNEFDNEKSESSESENSDVSENLTEEVKDEKRIEKINDSFKSINAKKNLQLDPIFLKNFGKCLYPSCFMDMITLNKYYCIPQCEETLFNYSHELSLELLGIIFKILTNNNGKTLMVIARNKKSIKSFTLPDCHIIVPSLESIFVSEISARKAYMLNFLNIEAEFQKHVSSFREEWHLFLYTIKYALTKSNFDLAFIHSLIFCFFILNYVDTKIGFYRSTKAFEKKYSTQVQNISENPNLRPKVRDDNFDPSFYECAIFMDKMVSYFQVDLKLRTNFRLYEKTLVHTMAQMQSCFLHVKHLNCLLDLPFSNLTMHTIFDGTFIYNMTSNLRKRTNVKNYIVTFLKDCPNIILATSAITGSLESYCEKLESLEVNKVKRKKKKKLFIENENSDKKEYFTESEKEESVDPNNFFSLLSVI